jgi:mono/diheme cytochrome c family protein
VRNIITGLSALVLIAGLGTAACAAEEPAKTDDKSSSEAPAAGGAPAGEEKPAGETPAAAEGEKPAAGGETAAAGGECCKAGDTTPTLDLVKAVPKGGLHNPYNDKIDATQEAGHKLYMGLSCNGCHGGGGGGGMCPPLTNQTWIYGRDDDTLFRLVALGSAELQKTGSVRKGSENVVGPMPPFGQLIKTSDDLWKMIAWIRYKNPDSLKPSAVPPPPQ